jgi:uncharacterized protein
MRISELIESLRNPAAFPHPANDLEVLQTHISVVVLAGSFAYKVKKPLDLGFLDFTTLERRRHFCEEEVRLNRRLAPEIYLGVVPIFRTVDGLRVGDGPGEGPALEYAVRMRRLPPGGSLGEELRRGDLQPEVLDALGRRLARFHREAEGGPEVARFGEWAVVAGNARENLEQTVAHVGRTVSSGVHRRLAELLELRLEELRPLIESRAQEGRPRDTHGDLHLEHVYLLPHREPPSDLLVIDCIEFNERFRNADPICDAAFLSMDLAYEGRRDLGERFERAYLAASGDLEGAALLPFYRSYRAAVRAKVLGMVTGPEVPEGERRTAEARARGHWLLALSELEEPPRRPALLLVGGLPGSGKSTLARNLASAAKFRVISSDRVRKELAGHPPEEDLSADFGAGIYTEEWTDRTYAACLDAAREGLFSGERIMVDATFSSDGRRLEFLEAARRMGVRSGFLTCTAKPARVRARLARRAEGDDEPQVSDADWAVYSAMAERWEVPLEQVAAVTRSVTTDGDPEDAVRAGEAALGEFGLL